MGGQSQLILLSGPAGIRIQHQVHIKMLSFFLLLREDPMMGIDIQIVNTDLIPRFLLSHSYSFPA